MRTRRLPAEFETQSFVQLIFPHAMSDWAPYLDEACRTFAKIANAIALHEACLIICDDIRRVRAYFSAFDNLHFITYQSDDTWARDCSAITIIENDRPLLLDFTFTGWGDKFEAARDNAMSAEIAGHYAAPLQHEDFILEGGAIESNGSGTLLTTVECLLNPNRNTKLTHKSDIETVLYENLGVKRVLWLEHGYLTGDDTDSHVDTLARFIDERSIMYLHCSDPEDEHYEELALMEKELHAFRDERGEPYRLIPLPITNAIYYDNERLPATYANFLMINGAVLVPTYNDLHDDQALQIFRETFPQRKIIGIDCSILIRQHGSLHCVTMQFPKNVLLK